MKKQLLLGLVLMSVVGGISAGTVMEAEMESRIENPSAALKTCMTRCSNNVIVHKWQGKVWCYCK